MEAFDPSQITLKTTSKAFSYERISRQIDKCDDIVMLKEMLRSYVKLHLKHQELVADIVNPPPLIKDEQV